MGNDHASRLGSPNTNDAVSKLGDLRPKPITESDEEAVKGGAGTADTKGDKADMKTGVANITKKA